MSTINFFNETPVNNQKDVENCSNSLKDESSEKVNSCNYMKKHYYNNNSYKYQLRAVCQHIGDHSSGHFITLRKELFFKNQMRSSERDNINNEINDLPKSLNSSYITEVTENNLNEWYKVSDDHVTEIDEESLNHCQPYLLVYDKIIATGKEF
uniref:USP domain-containing protein n=1 Tax=Parastrongyloides trichosuri TaxID=131310 RepID=A0A0N4ZV01_PARTI